MNPITLLSLLSTGISLVTGKSLAGSVIQGVEELLGLNDKGENAQSFAGLLNDTQSVINSTRSSLNVTPQGGINGLIAEGAASLVPANSGAAVTEGTLQSLNEILGDTGTDTSDNPDLSDALAETEATNDGGLANGQKLDDPFGIKAARTNGSPIAAPVAVPAPLIPAASGNIVNEDGEVLDSGISTVRSAAAATGNPVTTARVPSDPNAIAQQAALSNTKAEDKKDLFKLGENPAAGNVNNADDIINNETKTARGRSDPHPSVFANSERFADKTNVNQNQHPDTAAFLAHEADHRGIGDVVRTIRAKDELKEKLATIDTYKIVNVTKRDNVLDLRLEPAQLGKVQIKFDFTDGKTNIAVFADRPETLDLLQKDTKSIQKILSDNGIASDSNSMSFNLSQQQKNEHNNFNFFAGRPLSFRVEQEIPQIAANINNNEQGYSQYGETAANGMLNILV